MHAVGLFLCASELAEVVWHGQPHGESALLVRPSHTYVLQGAAPAVLGGADGGQKGAGSDAHRL